MNRWRHRVAADAGHVAGSALLGLLVAAVLAGAVGLLTLLLAMPFGPMVGEILVFGPYDQPPPVWHVDAVRLSDGQHCELKPAVMAASHGSLVVEQRLAGGRRFQVHWAGGRTSDGSADCGAIGDLALGLPEMQTLMNAAEAARWRLLGA